MRDITVATHLGGDISYVAVGEHSHWSHNEMPSIQVEPTQVFVDTSSAIDLSKNPVLHKTMKHVELRYKWLKEICCGGELVLQKVPTADNPADICTKALPPVTFHRHRSRLVCRVNT